MKRISVAGRPAKSMACGSLFATARAARFPVLLGVDIPAFAHASADAPHQRLAEGDLQRESGEKIRDFSVSFMTDGTRNADKSHAILLVTAIGGNHPIAAFLNSLQRH